MSFVCSNEDTLLPKSIGFRNTKLIHSYCPRDDSQWYPSMVCPSNTIWIQHHIKLKRHEIPLNGSVYTYHSPQMDLYSYSLN